MLVAVLDGAVVIDDNAALADNEEGAEELVMFIAPEELRARLGSPVGGISARIPPTQSLSLSACGCIFGFASSASQNTESIELIEGHSGWFAVSRHYFARIHFSSMVHGSDRWVDESAYID